MRMSSCCSRKNRKATSDRCDRACHLSTMDCPPVHQFPSARPAAGRLAVLPDFLSCTPSSSTCALRQSPSRQRVPDQDIPDSSMALQQIFILRTPRLPHTLPAVGQPRSRQASARPAQRRLRQNQDAGIRYSLFHPGPGRPGSACPRQGAF